MELLKLPSEIILLIGDNLPTSSLNSLCQTSRNLCTLLTPLLYNSMNPTYVLHWAIMRHRIHLLKLAIKKGADLHATDIAGWASLHVAVDFGYMEIIDILLDHEVDIDMRIYAGVHRPIHLAVINNNEMVLKKLIDRGASVCMRSDHKSPMIIAVERRNERIIKVLLEKGGDVDQRYAEALNIAVKCGNEAIIRLLVESNRIKNLNVYGLAFLARFCGRKRIENYLLGNIP